MESSAPDGIGSPSRPSPSWDNHSSFGGCRAKYSSRSERQSDSLGFARATVSAQSPEHHVDATEYESMTLRLGKGKLSFAERINVTHGAASLTNQMLMRAHGFRIVALGAGSQRHLAHLAYRRQFVQSVVDGGTR